MSDALISPAVGGAMWAATAVTTAYCAKRVREESDESKVPLMGVAGAFIFAAQMLNFTIPGTGSSGHIGGGLILAILLGPEAAFLVMVSILGVQALFFADGGLLSLGANIFNLGFLSAFVAYPLVYRPIVGARPTSTRIAVGGLLGGVTGLMLGATGVVLQTTFSGVSELPFTSFIALMLPIHLAIGVVEGLVTAGVVLFVRQAQPEILARSATGRSLKGVNVGPVLVALLAAALISGGALAWFASSNPDGLEWSIEQVTGSAEIDGVSGPLQGSLERLQERTAIFPDYAPKSGSGDERARTPIDAGTSVSGLVGAALVLAIAGGVVLLLKKRSASRRSRTR